jgi:hypothetical protein
MGLNKQLRMMFDPVRVYATAIYGGCVVFALIFALLVSNLYLSLFIYGLIPVCQLTT